MELESGLGGGFGLEPSLCNLFPFVYLKVHKGLYLVCLTLRKQV